MTRKNEIQQRIRIFVLAFGTVAVPLSAQPPPTPHQRQVFDNVDKVESSISLDKAEYLPGEIARITVTIRNPTASALEIPAPFKVGRCEILPLIPTRPELVGHFGGVAHALTTHVSWNVPTLVLAPGQVVTKTETTLEHTAWKNAEVPMDPGEWWVGYSYDHRMGALFRVVEPLKATAITSVRLPPEEITDYQTQKRVMHSGSVILLAVEVAPRDYRLVRAAMFEDISHQLNPSNPAGFLRQLYGYETVGTSDEEVTSLKASMGNDDTVDVTAVTASQREIHMNVPARPAKTASTEKQ
jgi:hypothetical protein